MKFIALTATLFAAISVPASALSPDDFAYGVPLTVQQPGAIHRVTLPAEVYKYAVRPNLGDIRVFNGAGEVVPYALRQQGRTVNKSTQAVPVFPIRTRSGTESEHLQLRLERNQSVTTVDIQSPEEGTEKILRGYVLDVRGLTQPLTTLSLYWDAPAADFTQKVNFEASEDLVHWRPVGRDAAIAHLRQGADEIQRNRIELPPGRYEFLRIMTDDSFPVNLVRIEAESVEETIPAMHWLAVAPTKAADGRYFVTIPGQIKVERFRIAPARTQYLSRVEVYSRSEKQRSWMHRGAGAIHQLPLGDKPSARDEIPVAHSMDREWQVRLIQAEGLGSEAPRIEVGWTPHELLFFAREPQPLRIAFGSVAAQPGAFPLNEFVANVDPKGSILIAQAGAAAALGGGPRREDAIAGTGTRIALWSLLILGVAVLAAMAARLYRDLQQPPVS